METIILGGYTRRENKGIRSVKLNAETKKLEDVVLKLPISSPTYLTKVGNFLFSIIQEDNWAGVALIGLNEQKEYDLIATALTEDVNPPCYVSFDKKRQLVYSANYHQGFFEVIELNEKGLEVVDTVQHEGHSVHENQKSAHVHYIQVDNNQKFVLVCDLGTDSVYTYEIDEHKQAKEVSCLKTPAGFGPRHLAQHPTLPIIYVVGELSNQVQVCEYDETNGTLMSLAIYSTLPEDYKETSSAAAIRVSKDGKFLYVSNRGHNSIVVYQISETGQLQALQWINSGGKTPRDFNFNQDEKFIVVGHQDSSDLVLFERDEETGLLKQCDSLPEALECVCVVNGN